MEFERRAGLVSKEMACMVVVASRLTAKSALQNPTSAGRVPGRVILLWSTNSEHGYRLVGVT